MGAASYTLLPPGPRASMAARAAASESAVGVAPPPAQYSASQFSCMMRVRRVLTSIANRPYEHCQKKGVVFAVQVPHVIRLAVWG